MRVGCLQSSLLSAEARGSTRAIERAQEGKTHTRASSASRGELADVWAGMRVGRGLEAVLAEQRTPCQQHVESTREHTSQRESARTPHTHTISASRGELAGVWAGTRVGRGLEAVLAAAAYLLPAARWKHAGSTREPTRKRENATHTHQLNHSHHLPDADSCVRTVAWLPATLHRRRLSKPMLTTPAPPLT